MRAFVADASVAIGWVHPAQATAQTDSMLEAIALCEENSGKKLSWTYEEQNRTGDHIWYVSDVAKFEGHYPGWQCRFDLRRTLEEIHDAVV